MAAEPKDVQKELEIEISELEDRIDRLRATYEQYFLGFEKMEPMVQRKDVDRRFVNLRKQQIRNTAQRFRFSVVTQKYNTYSMYWVRICRQIEEGTYKRHLVKAKRLAEAPAPAEQRRRGPKEGEDSIEVELGDLEGDAVDMDAVIAEATAAAESYTRGATDTVPPELQVAIVGAPPKTPPKMAALAAPMGQSTPMHALRPAELPPGVKPRVLIRRTPANPIVPIASLPASPPPPERAPVPVPVPERAPAPARPITPANPVRPMAPPAGRPNPAPMIRPRAAPPPAIARPEAAPAPVAAPAPAIVRPPRPPPALPSGGAEKPSS